MISFRLLTLLSLFYIVLTKSDKVDIEEEDNVLVLTDTNFEEAVTSNNILLVEFYAPWCGHCKSLAPEYAKAAANLKNNDPVIRIAKLDATANKETAEKYAIQGFPTIKLFRGSTDPLNAKDFEGGRTADEIEQWMIKKSGPLVKIISTVDELDKLKEENDVVVVGLLEKIDGNNKLELEKVAENIDSIFVATTNKEIVQDDVTSAPGIVLYKKFDEGKNIFGGKFVKEEIIDFVESNHLPLIVTYSQEKASQIFGGNVETHLLLFSDESNEYNAELVEQVKKSATENKKNIMHIVIPVTQSRILDYFSLKADDLPSVMLVNMAGGMKKFPFQSKSKDLIDKINDKTFQDELFEFEKEYLDGNLQPTLKSAEPVDDTNENVKVIVGKDFQERVINNEKDVLLEFYAPWCGHCKSLAPKYEELAETFSSVDTIMIAKMDATENEIDYPSVEVKGFPTLYFFPGKDKKNPIAYDGEREVDGFTQFLKKNAQPFDLEAEENDKEDIEEGKESTDKDRDEL